MKKLLLSLLVLLSMTSYVNAQEVTENGPEIEFEKTTHQFGEIPFKGREQQIYIV